MQDEKLKKLEAILNVIETGGVTKQEFQQFFDMIAGIIRELKSQLEKQMSEKHQMSMNECMRIMSDMSNMEERMKKMMSEMDMSSKMDDLSKRLTTEIDIIEATIPTTQDINALEGKISEIKASIKDISSLEIRDKLELIKTESEKLDILAIKDLRKELDDLHKKISNTKGITIFGGGGGNGGGRITKAYDLSSSLNGVTKTFTLPAFWRIISVHSSSFPFIFKPTTDYTVNVGTMSITFTSEIDAASTLVSGQTITIIYSE